MDDEVGAPQEDEITSMQTIPSLIRALNKLQRERFEAYRFWDRGYEEYMRGAPNYNFDMYKILVATITDSFKSLSQAVTAVGTRMTSLGRQDLAALVTVVQKAEQEKLTLTVKYQLLNKDVVDGAVSESDDLPLIKRTMAMCTQRVADVLEQLRYEDDGDE